MPELAHHLRPQSGVFGQQEVYRHDASLPLADHDRQPTVLRLSSSRICSLRALFLFRRRFDPRLAGPEHDEVRQREVDRKARAYGQKLGKEHGDPIGRDDERGGVGDHAGNARQYECAIGAPAELTTGFRGEGDEAIHNVGPGDCHQPRQEVRGNERQLEYRVSVRNTVKSIRVLTMPITAKLAALSMSARRGIPPRDGSSDALFAARPASNLRSQHGESQGNDWAGGSPCPHAASAGKGATGPSALDRATGGAEQIPSP